MNKSICCITWENERVKEQGRRVKLSFLSKSLNESTLAVIVGQSSKGSVCWDRENLSINIAHFWWYKSGRDIYTCVTCIILSTTATFNSRYFTALAKHMWQRRERKSKKLLCDVTKGHGALPENHHLWLDVVILSQVHLWFYFHKFKLHVLFLCVQRVGFWCSLGHLVRFWAYHTCHLGLPLY